MYRKELKSIRYAVRRKSLGSKAFDLNLAYQMARQGDNGPLSDYMKEHAYEKYPNDETAANDAVDEHMRLLNMYLDERAVLGRFRHLHTNASKPKTIPHNQLRPGMIILGTDSSRGDADEAHRVTTVQRPSSGVTFYGAQGSHSYPDRGVTGLLRGDQQVQVIHEEPEEV